MVNGFRIRRIAIEGFKAFTTRTEIDFRGRHVFLLGQNGNGKSSIIEAIRWGLIGSTDRPHDIVAHEGYSGPCRVEIGLTQEGKEWQLYRSLTRGTRRSRRILIDEHGEKHKTREIMPQLDSLKAGERTHIIFASQSAPLRRQPEDLKPFERTVLNHLGLTHPQALLRHLERFLADHENIENELGDRLTDVQRRIERGVSDLVRRRGTFLGGDPPPTLAESENKARALIKRITGQSPDPSMAGKSLDALIEHADDALREHQEQRGQHTKLEKVRGRLARLEKICRIQAEADAKRSNLEEIKGELDAILDGATLLGLRGRLERGRHAAQTMALKRRLVDISLEVLSRDDGDPVICPACAKQHPREDMASALRHAEKTLPDDDSNLCELEEQVQQAEESDRRIQVLCGELERLELQGTELIEEDELTDGHQIASQIKLLSEQMDSIETKIQNREEWRTVRQRELSNLKEEEQYHHTQKKLRRLERLGDELERARRRFRTEIIAFGKSVQKIYDAVNSCFSDQFEEMVPRVADELTRVFVALTSHPHFDQLIIDTGNLPHFELQVSSSRDPISRHHTGVLNGQAQSALRLVPYFALTQAHEAPTEVYLVLLDDPTRAFDEEHIEILIERFAHLGRRVQLIVASQETARFQELIPQNFERRSYVVVEPKNWSYDNGPELAVAYQ